MKGSIVLAISEWIGVCNHCEHDFDGGMRMDTHEEEKVKRVNFEEEE